mmetsp:Transcript_33122/g.36930  ORF Transcript_33122/g.36930 Transcript_33122/m.36930 type:complete len:128 (-) Transcript_33122:233-616(-)
MKFELFFVLSCLFVSATAQVRGNASIKRHRLAESDSKFVDLTADISESEMLRIKQRYLSIRVSAQTDDVIGRADKEDKSNTDKDDIEDFSMSMDGIQGRADKEDKTNTDKDDVEDFSMLMNESSMEG